MTVGELIDMLEDFNPDTEVVIGMKQNCGSDFMKQIVDVRKRKVSPFYSNDTKCVVITEGQQLGVVRY